MRIVGVVLLIGSLLALVAARVGNAWVFLTAQIGREPAPDVLSVVDWILLYGAVAGGVYLVLRREHQ